VFLPVDRFLVREGQGRHRNALAAKKSVSSPTASAILACWWPCFSSFWNFGSLDFSTVFAAAPQVAAAHPTTLLLITLFMLLVSPVNRHNYPCMSGSPMPWLVDTVSALNPCRDHGDGRGLPGGAQSAFYALVPAAQTAVTWVGAATALFAATIAVAQTEPSRKCCLFHHQPVRLHGGGGGQWAPPWPGCSIWSRILFQALLFLAAGSVIPGHGTRGDMPANPASRSTHRICATWVACANKSRSLSGCYLIGGIGAGRIGAVGGVLLGKMKFWQASRKGHLAAIRGAGAGRFPDRFLYRAPDRDDLLWYAAQQRQQPHASESSRVVTVPLMILGCPFLLGDCSTPRRSTWRMAGTHAGRDDER